MVTLTGQQLEAVERIGKFSALWLGRDVFRLSGAAGTGKTTLIRHLVERHEGCRVLAPTNRAVSVLAEKGVPGPMTVHSAIYYVDEQLIKDQIKALLALKQPLSKENQLKLSSLQDELDDCHRWNRDATKLQFRLAPKERCALAEARMVIIDEATMVGSSLMEDIKVQMPEGAKIVAIGDNRQLPPVSDDDFFGAKAADFELTESFRVRDDASGLSRAMLSAYLPGLGDERWALRDLLMSYNSDGTVVYLPHVSTSRSMARFTLLDADVVICHSNATRHLINSAKRALLGIEGAPQPGEPVIAMFTDDDISKGEIFKVGEVVADKLKSWVVRMRRPTGEVLPEVSVLKEFWRAPEKLIRQHRNAPAKEYKALQAGKPRAGEFARAYALTAHSAQGGEWDRVLVLDEHAHYRFSPTEQQDIDNRRRWRYTAITRARSGLTVLPWSRYWPLPSEANGQRELF